MLTPGETFLKNIVLKYIQNVFVKTQDDDNYIIDDICEHLDNKK